MKKKKLKVTTSTPHSMMFESGEPIIDIFKYKGLSNLPNDIDIYRMNVYLHGNIENKAGFDIPVWLEGEFVDEGIHDVEVVLPNETIQCQMFIWKIYEHSTWCIKGYIIDKNDKKSLKFVKKQYKLKPNII